MKWTIRLELTPDGNPPNTSEIGTVTRSIADLSPEEIGLTLEEGQELLRQLQIQIIASQAHAYALCGRRCAYCGKPKHVKDVPPSVFKLFSALFGFEADGISRVVVAPIPTGTDMSSGLVKSSRGGQPRRCAIYSRSWALGCRTAQLRRYLKCAVSAI